jgi:uncharacterized OsmC-like protein
MSVVNGIDAGKLEHYKEKVRADPSRAGRQFTVAARWEGGPRSSIEFEGKVVGGIGGDGELSPMQALLASLAACDVDVVATHAALIGLEIEELSVEATGDFDVHAYLGLEGAGGSGFQHIRYRVRIKARTASPEQVERLRQQCERGSPVGDSLARPIPLEFEIDRL